MTRTTLTALSADDLVATVHPFGQWSDQHTADAAKTIAELVRYLNHATIDTPDQAIGDPNTAAAVLGALHTTSQRLPQLLGQLRGRMLTLADDPDLATGSSTDTAPALAERSAQALAQAETALGQLTTALRDAWQAADRLYLDNDEDE